MNTRVRVVGAGKSAKAKAGELLCQFGVHVKIDPLSLEQFCFKRLSEREEDLVALTGAVAFADRRARRPVAEGWSRSLHIIIPVREPEFWIEPALQTSLVNALRFLTGDAWSFEFVQKSARGSNLKQTELPLGEGKFVVMPFSNGLDSFCQSRILAYERPDVSIIRVTAWNRSLAGGRDWVTDVNGARYRRVCLPVSVDAGHHADQTFRSRSFMFSALAGLAAAMADAEFIAIPEAGQGSIGPSLVPVGQESPHRGSHPKFSRLMTDFFRVFWKKPVEIRHPQLWRTKGEVLGFLRANKLEEGWNATSSCSRDQRVMPTARHKRLQCGLCSGCLLRRMSLRVAGFTEPDSIYFFQNLSAPTLEQMLCPDAQRSVSSNDRDIGVHAVLAMEELAEQADLPSSDTKIMRASADAWCTPRSESLVTQSELVRLLRQHRNEWRAFLEELDSNSWLRQQIH